MNHIQVLDCTLRDGGYVNDWRFGRERACEIHRAVSGIGVSIAELGFFRDEAYFPDRMIFDSSEHCGEIIGERDGSMLYAAMIEMANYYPVEKLSKRIPGGLDMIRYAFWKRLMDDAYEYCARIKEKGYILCCQPTRVEQYTEDEFAAMCRRFSALEPYAVYIVDTFGLLQKEDLLRYARIGHESLAPGVILGYHAHDNMGQAFTNACAFLEQDYGGRVVQVDASIHGIGRGAGNLKLEMLLDYLNRNHGGEYRLEPLYDAWDRCVKPVYREHPWGYDPAYLIVASNACNPNYASSFLRHGLTTAQIERAARSIEGDDKFLFSEEKAARYGGY